MNSFGTKIKKLRAAKGMKQDDLAKVIGVSKGTVSVWERNARFPEMDTIQRLVNYFEVPLSFLLDDSSGLTIQPQTNILIQNKAGIFASDQSHEDPEIFDISRNFPILHKPSIHQFFHQSVYVSYGLIRYLGKLSLCEMVVGSIRLQYVKLLL